MPVWALVAVGAVLIGLFAAPAQYFTWLPIVLAGGVLLTFSIQLAIVRREGLVNRVMASLGGSVAILALATAVLSIATISAG